MLSSYARTARGNHGCCRVDQRARIRRISWDKAYDADWLREQLHQRGSEAVIPARAKRRNPASYDAEKYKWRHLVENFFQKFKEFKGIAMRACKTDLSLAAMIYLAATVIRTR